MKIISVYRFKRVALAATLTSALATAALFSLPPNAMAVPAETDAVGAGVQYGPPSFADLAERVEPAVVSIAVSGKTEVSAQMNSPTFPQGKGFEEFFKQFRDRLPGAGNGAPREFKGAGSWDRPLTAEQRAHFQTVLDDFHHHFMALISERRNLDMEAVRALFPAESADSDNRCAQSLPPELPVPCWHNNRSTPQRGLPLWSCREGPIPLLRLRCGQESANRLFLP